MLDMSKRGLLLVVLNAFSDAIAIAILGIFAEVLYRLFVHFDAMSHGMEFFPMLACFAVAAILIVIKLPSVARAWKAVKKT